MLMVAVLSWWFQPVLSFRCRGRPSNPSLRALCDWADRWAQLLRLVLTVLADNSRTIALHQRCGFAQEGLPIGFALRDGHCVATVAAARLHPHPPRWTPRA
jgi:putative acetyltransferase